MVGLRSAVLEDCLIPISPWSARLPWPVGQLVGPGDREPLLGLPWRCHRVPSPSGSIVRVFSVCQQIGLAGSSARRSLLGVSLPTVLPSTWQLPAQLPSKAVSSPSPSLSSIPVGRRCRPQTVFVSVQAFSSFRRGEIAWQDRKPGQEGGAGPASP